MKIPYGKQWITKDDTDRVLEVLQSDYLTTGPTIQEFEEAFAKYVGSKYAIAVANGTAALHLSAMALGVTKGSEVITTPMSFAATANCIRYCNGEPIFSDITGRGLIDPNLVETNLTEKTIGIIPVHLMGLPCDLERLSRIAKEHNLFIIEDASHAIGAQFKNSKIGDCKYSELAVFSFHPVKHITTGEGGIVTTNNEELYDLLRLLRTHGITKNQSEFKTKNTDPWYQEMLQLGFNYRMTDIQAALGLSQLSKIDSFVKRRREIAAIYIEFFQGFSEHVETISEDADEVNSYHLFVIKLKDAPKRRELFDFLRSKGIFCQVHYVPIYWHPYYRESGFKDFYLPNTETYYNSILSLPMYPAMTNDELNHVLSSLKQFFE